MRVTRRIFGYLSMVLFMDSHKQANSVQRREHFDDYMSIILNSKKTKKTIGNVPKSYGSYADQDSTYYIIPYL
jgi:hypothetical protein